MSLFDGPIPASLAEGGWLVILLVAPGLLALVAVVIAFLFRPRRTSDGPGYYHVLGFEEGSGKPRDLTVHAGSVAGARARAALEGIIVTEVRRVEGESSSSSSES
jgi:hypothetical protein